MNSSNAIITFGNEKKVFTTKPYPVALLNAYSNTGKLKLEARENGSKAIVFSTCEGLEPRMEGVVTVLRFFAKHPLHGYPKTYKGRKQLTVELAEKMAGHAITFEDKLRIHEALLLLGPKDHLGRQFDVRKAITEHIKHTLLTPDELKVMGFIFLHDTTKDEKLVDFAINATMDFIDAGWEDYTMPQETIDALEEAYNSIPAMADKMARAMVGKAARVERAQAKFDRAAAYQAKRARVISFKRSKEHARLSVEAWATRQNQIVAEAKMGLRALPESNARYLITGGQHY